MTSSAQLVSVENSRGATRVSYKIKVRLNPGKNPPQYEDVPAITFSVFVVPKLIAPLVFHFPNDDANKRTTRAGYDLFNETPTIRSGERARLVNAFVTTLGNNWNQATIDFYPTNFDNDNTVASNLGADAWNGDDFRTSFPNGAPDPGGIDGALPKNWAGYVNIYFVHNLVTHAQEDGITFNNIRVGWNKTAIVLDDGAIPQTGGVLQHEIGHTWGLGDESEQNPAIVGTVNNLLPVFGVPNTYNFYTMTAQNRQGEWLSERESFNSRVVSPIVATSE